MLFFSIGAGGCEWKSFSLRKKFSFTLVIFAFVDVLEGHFKIAMLGLENLRFAFKKYKTRNTCTYKIEGYFTWLAR